MKRTSFIFIISFFLLNVINIYAQNFKVGLQVESMIYYTNNTVRNQDGVIMSGNISRHYSPFPTSVYLKLGSDVNNIFSFEFRTGLILGDDYSGVEAGIFSRFTVYKSLGLLVFFMHHSNSGGGDHNGGGSITSNVELLGLGTGVKVTDNLIIEFLYSLPLNESQIGWSRTWDYQYDGSSLKSIIKIGLGFEFNIAGANY